MPRYCVDIRLVIHRYACAIKIITAVVKIVVDGGDFVCLIIHSEREERAMDTKKKAIHDLIIGTLELSRFNDNGTQSLSKCVTENLVQDILDLFTSEAGNE